MTVLSDEPNELKYLVNICKDTSNLEGFTLQGIKSVALKENTIRQYPENESWTLGDKKMPVVDNTAHIGILQSSSNQELNVVEQNTQKARRTSYSLMGTDLQGENELDPETSIPLLNLYIFPVLTWKQSFLQESNAHFRKTTQKTSQANFIYANNCAIYLQSGALPNEAFIHKRILSLCGNITRMSCQSIEVSLFK